MPICQSSWQSSLVIGSILYLLRIPWLLLNGVSALDHVGVLTAGIQSTLSLRDLIYAHIPFQPHLTSLCALRLSPSCFNSNLSRPFCRSLSRLPSSLKSSSHGPELAASPLRTALSRSLLPCNLTIGSLNKSMSLFMMDV